MTALRSTVVVPLGRLVDARWSEPAAENLYRIAVPHMTFGIDDDELELWLAAAGGQTRRELLDASPIDGPQTVYSSLESHGLIAELPTEPAALLREATALRLLAHSRVDLHARHGAVVGDAHGEFAVLSPPIHEIYCWSEATHSLAAAVALVASRASEAGLNDLDVILPELLVVHAVEKLLPLVRAGYASFMPVLGSVEEMPVDA